MTNTKNILMMSQRLEEMLFRYLRSCPCAPSTFANVSSMFSSILHTIHTGQQNPGSSESWQVSSTRYTEWKHYTLAATCLHESKHTLSLEFSHLQPMFQSLYFQALNSGYLPNSRIQSYPSPLEI